jgi:hypothetical protein
VLVKTGHLLFQTKVVPIGKSVAVNIGKIVDGQMALLLATVV